MVLRKSELSNVVVASILPVRKPFPRGAERNEADSKFLEGRQHLLLGITVPERVFALHGGDRLNCVCATDGLCCCFRKPEVLDLALVNEVLHGSRHVFDRDLGVHAVLIEEVDGIDPEPLERAFGRLRDVLRPAVQADPTRTPIGLELVGELGGYDDPPAEGEELFADEFFVGVRAIDFSSIEEGDPAIHGRMEKREHLVPVRKRSVGPAHSHAAEPDS